MKLEFKIVNMSNDNEVLFNKASVLDHEIKELVKEAYDFLSGLTKKGTDAKDLQLMSLLHNKNKVILYFEYEGKYGQLISQTSTFDSVNENEVAEYLEILKDLLDIQGANYTLVAI